MLKRTPPLLMITGLLLASGCGRSSKTTTTSSSSGSAVSTTAPEGGGALAADAKSAATGDIPDTQNFLTLKAMRLRVAMLYPEGWTVLETGSGVSINDKNNLVRIVISHGPAPTATSVQAQLGSLKRSTPGL